MIERLELIRTRLLPLLAEQGAPDVLVVTAFQPDSQGRTDGPTLYLQQLPVGGNYGWQGRSATFDSNTQTMTRKESQIVREGFQLTALNDTGVGIAPIDLHNLAKLLVGSQAFRQALRLEKVGIERIVASRTPDWSNDRERFEQSPSFDFTLTHTTAIIQQARYFERAEINVTRV
jgi:hypothetical protein